jgi:superoxide dismutase, Fe-Mn family
MDINEPFSRRDFLSTAGKAGMAAGLSVNVLTTLANNHSGGAKTLSPDPIAYQQAPLAYSYGALEPSIDAMTMEIHYTKHAAGYAKNLGEAVAAEKVDMDKMKLEDVLAGISKYSVKMRNNAGGHYNHELFWKTMAASGSGGAASPKLQAAITRDFGSLDGFKTKFSDTAKARFGSGWTWLLWQNNHLAVGSTPNQDNPLMDISDLKGMPVFGLDVWEHAYYLKYQNKRPDYITAWWNVVNWNFISKRFDQLG